MISVNVEWGAMTFTYTVSGTHNWNASMHEYTTDAEGAWSANGNTVTVTIHSNIAVKTKLAFAADAAYDTVIGSFDNAVLNLASAETDPGTGSGPEPVRNCICC